jgi:hypothetical protein
MANAMLCIYIRESCGREEFNYLKNTSKRLLVFCTDFTCIFWLLNLSQSAAFSYYRSSLYLYNYFA